MTFQKIGNLLMGEKSSHFVNYNYHFRKAYFELEFIEHNNNEQKDLHATSIMAD